MGRATRIIILGLIGVFVGGLTAGPVAAQNPPAEAVTVTVDFLGQGTVGLEPPGGVYAPGTSVALTAFPDPGYYFQHWEDADSGRKRSGERTWRFRPNADTRVVCVCTPEYTAFFDDPLGFAGHWEWESLQGFGVQAGVLACSGLRGPNTLIGLDTHQDQEMSLWYSLRDARSADTIPEGEGVLQIQLRRSASGDAVLYAEITPRGMALYERRGAQNLELDRADGVVTEPNAWYSLRLRAVGQAVRVWRRGPDGGWNAPILATNTAALTYTAATHGLSLLPGSHYEVDNLRLRPCGRNIESNVDAIDEYALDISIPDGVAAQVLPSGGVYPPDEDVYITVRDEGDQVFQHWGGEDADPLVGTSSPDLTLTMDAAKALTAEFRTRYAGANARFGSAAYDSTYAPAGYTPVRLDTLVQRWTDADGVVHEYLPGTVTLTVPDFPDDDPLHEVTIASPDDTRDDSGGARVLKYPVGAKVTVRATPNEHPAGFQNNLFGWATNPGSAINQCPEPEKAHSFTIPPVAPETPFELRLLAPTVGQVSGMQPDTHQ